MKAIVNILLSAIVLCTVFYNLKGAFKTFEMHLVMKLSSGLPPLEKLTGVLVKKKGNEFKKQSD